MTFPLTKKLSRANKLSSALVVAALATTGMVLPGFVSPVRADVVTPAVWLQRQPKPVFKSGHTLPRLTRFGWDLSYETSKVVAEDWNYVLQTNYLTDATVAAFNDPTSREGKMGALTLSDPAKYPLGVILSRDEPASPEPQTFLRDAAGNLIDGQQIYSPLNPQSVLDQMAALRANPLRALRAKVPINMILNGGEYGLGVVGDANPFQRDPAVAAAQAQSGDSWFTYLSKAKGNECQTIANAVRAAVPDRSLYIYYATGSTERNRYWGWKSWSIDETYMLSGSDLPSSEHYYKSFNDGYDASGGNDILTRALNATGFEIAKGKKLSYNWLTAGWISEGGGANSPPVYDPATSGTASISSMSVYTGFLKCIFTAGTIGGNAGYYDLPAGGFDASFEAARSPYYLPQMTTLSHVQSLFSYLENDVRGSDLLAGPNMHAKSTDQPVYEFPTGSAGSRVLARKVTGQNKWIITAWAADGVDRTVNVTIPTLGKIALLARTAGSVYIATIVNNLMQLTLTDSNAMTPTVGGYAPVDVTPAPSSNPVNVFANGGFETPVLSGGGAAIVYNPTGSAWSFVSNSGIQRNGSAWSAPNAPEGSQTAFLQGLSSGLGSISQATSFSAGTYKVQFQAAQRGGQLQPIQGKVDGVNVGSPITPTSNSFALYTSADFTVTAGSHTISLSATDGSGDKSSFIDDVKIL